jgi:DmsE family decaheme c-type cytochrome
MARRRWIIAAVTMGIALAGLSLGLLGDEPQNKAGGYVGAKTCATCHEDVVTSFKTSGHGLAMAAQSKDLLDKACEACHGPGAAHAKDPSKTNIQRVPTPQACLGCHPKAEALMALNLPAHARNNIQCLDCHAPAHTPAAAEPLLKAKPRELCGKCHATEAAQFLMPFTHRQGEKPFECTACHTVHGENRTGRLRMEQSGVCIKCHTDKAGPFIYTHPPRNAEGCLACHSPHGSPNPKMLNRYRVSDLCLECHTSVPDYPAWHNLSQPRFRNCTNCHFAVHGSNHDPLLKDE